MLEPPALFAERCPGGDDPGEPIAPTDAGEPVTVEDGSTQTAGAVLRLGLAGKTAVAEDPLTAKKAIPFDECNHFYATYFYSKLRAYGSLRPKAVVHLLRRTPIDRTGRVPGGGCGRTNGSPGEWLPIIEPPARLCFDRPTMPASMNGGLH